MKLSEMNTQQLAACLCKIAEPVERIGTDEAVVKAMRDMNVRLKDGTLMEKIAAMIGALVPTLLGTHFDDVVVIVAAMTGKTEDGVRAQNGFVTIRDIRSFFDEDFAGFFRPSAAQEPEP